MNGSTSVLPVSTVRDLGIFVDCDLVMRIQYRTVLYCFAMLRQLRSIRYLVSASVFQLLVTVLWSSGLWTMVTVRWLVFQNAAARLIFRLRRSDHITDALVNLHWLRVPECITYKVADPIPCSDRRRTTVSAAIPPCR